MDITALAQAWVDGSQPNNGLILLSPPVVGGNENKYHSADKANEPHPKLTLTYSCECGTVCTGFPVGTTAILSTDSDATLGGLSFDDIDLVDYDPATDTASLFFEGSLTTLDVDIDAVHVLANGHILLSPANDATLGGLSFENGDLVDYDPVADTSTLIFDGSALFSDPAEKIVSVHVLDNGHFVLSTDSDAILGGLSFEDIDLVEYDPATDTASLFFDGSLTTLDAAIDALHVLTNGHIVLSPAGTATLGGLSFEDEDLIDYDPATDTAILIFDGGEIFADNNEQIISAHIGPGSGTLLGTPGTIILATEGSATLGGLTFTDKDLAEYDPASDTATLFFDGVAHALAQDIDAVHVLANGNIVLSAINTITLGGVTAENEDLIVYNPVTDTGSLFFDGSALFSSGSTDLSAVHIMNAGHMLLTNEYSATLGGLAFEPNDIIDYDRDSDTAVMFLDGSTVGLSVWIDAVHLLDNGHIVLSTDQPATLGGLSFNEGDLVEYDPIWDTATVYFDGTNLFSAAEDVRAAHITGNSGEPETGPVAHWKLDDGTGPTALDSEGGHDGTLTNGPAWVAGQLGDALDFDGADDYVDLTSDAELDDVFVGGATVMAWIEPAGWGGNGYGRVFDKSSSPSATGDGWVIRMNVGQRRDHQLRAGLHGRTRLVEDPQRLDQPRHLAAHRRGLRRELDGERPHHLSEWQPRSVTRVDTPSGLCVRTQRSTCAWGPRDGHEPNLSTARSTMPAFTTACYRQPKLPSYMPVVVAEGVVAAVRAITRPMRRGRRRITIPGRRWTSALSVCRPTPWSKSPL